MEDILRKILLISQIIIIITIIFVVPSLPYPLSLYVFVLTAFYLWKDFAHFLPLIHPSV